MTANSGTLFLGGRVRILDGGTIEGQITESGVIELDGGTLNLNSLDSLVTDSLTLDIDNGTFSISANTGDLTIDTIVSDAGSTLDLGSNTLVISNGSTLNGTITTATSGGVGELELNNGTLTFNSINANVDDRLNVDINGGVFDISNNAGNITLNQVDLGSGTLDLGARSLTVLDGATLSGVLLSDTTAGTLILAGGNTIFTVNVDLTDPQENLQLTGGNTTFEDISDVALTFIDLAGGSLILNGNAGAVADTATLSLTSTRASSAGQISASASGSSIVIGDGATTNTVNLSLSGTTLQNSPSVHVYANSTLTVSSALITDTLTLDEDAQINLGSTTYTASGGTLSGIIIADNLGTLVLTDDTVVSDTVNLSDADELLEISNGILTFNDINDTELTQTTLSGGNLILLGNDPVLNNSDTATLSLVASTVSSHGDIAVADSDLTITLGDGTNVSDVELTIDGSVTDASHRPSLAVTSFSQLIVNSGDLVIDSLTLNGILNLNGNDLTVHGDSTLDTGSTINNTGTLIVAGGQLDYDIEDQQADNSFNVQQSGGTIDLTDNTGAITWNSLSQTGGTLDLGTRTLTLSQSTVSIGSTVEADAGGQIVLSNGGILTAGVDLSGTNESIVINGGTLTYSDIDDAVSTVTSLNNGSDLIVLGDVSGAADAGTLQLVEAITSDGQILVGASGTLISIGDGDSNTDNAVNITLTGATSDSTTPDVTIESDSNRLTLTANLTVGLLTAQGTLDVADDTLIITNGGTISGSVIATSGGEIELDGGTLQYNVTDTNGDTDLRFDLNGGTLDISANGTSGSDVTITALNIDNVNNVTQTVLTTGDRNLVIQGSGDSGTIAGTVYRKFRDI